MENSLVINSEHKLFIEKVTCGSNGHFLYSEVIPTTLEMIEEFRSKPCNHSLDVDKLCYDTLGWPYNSRYCGICGEFLGRI